MPVTRFSKLMKAERDTDKMIERHRVNLLRRDTRRDRYSSREYQRSLLKMLRVCVCVCVQFIVALNRNSSLSIFGKKF